MPGYKGDIVAGSTLHFSFNTRDASGNPITLAGTPVVKAYKQGSTTACTTNPTLTVDYNSQTGLHRIIVDTSVDGTFYAAGNDFFLIATAGTVSGVSIVSVEVGSFSIENRTQKADVRKLLGTAWLTPGTAGTPDVNAIKIGGTTQTARDIGASVIVGTNNDKTGYSLTTTPPTAVQNRQEMDANSTKLATLTTGVNATQFYGVSTQGVLSATGVGSTAFLANAPSGSGQIVVSNVIPSAAAISSQFPNQIGITTYNTLRVTLPAMGAISTRTALIFTLKKAATDADSAALIQISESGGLLIANGATASNASYGSLTVSDASAGTVNLYIHQSITALLTPTNGISDARVWDCIYKTSTDHNPPIGGKCIVTAGITRT